MAQRRSQRCLEGEIVLDDQRPANGARGHGHSEPVMTGDVSARPRSSSQVAEELIAAAATRAERFVCVVRIAFCAVIFLRFLLLGETLTPAGIPPKAWIEAAAIVLAIGFS